MYWGTVELESSSYVPWWRRRWIASNIETTAYALLAITKHDGTSIAFSTPIVKYLKYKQNGRGGFVSTQVAVI